MRCSWAARAFRRLDSIEIARGPQSTLYGGEAMGGVVALRTLKGEGAPSAQLGDRRRFVWHDPGLGRCPRRARRAGPTTLGMQAAGPRTSVRTTTFTGTTYAVRLDRQASRQLTVGATLRGFIGAYGSPGDRFTNDPDNREREQNQLATLFAEYTVSPRWSGRHDPGRTGPAICLGNPTPGEPTQTTVVTNRRGRTSTGRTRSCSATAIG
jgi:vitamin B12 transporter